MSGGHGRRPYPVIYGYNPIRPNFRVPKPIPVGRIVENKREEIVKEPQKKHGRVPLYTHFAELAPLYTVVCLNDIGVDALIRKEWKNSIKGLLEKEYLKVIEEVSALGPEGYNVVWLKLEATKKGKNHLLYAEREDPLGYRAQTKRQWSVIGEKRSPEMTAHEFALLIVKELREREKREEEKRDRIRKELQKLEYFRKKDQKKSHGSAT